MPGVPTTIRRRSPVIELPTRWSATTGSSANEATKCWRAHRCQRVHAGGDDDLKVPSVRWVVLHVIEETVAHSGHLDIAREMLDGRTDLGKR